MSLILVALSNHSSEMHVGDIGCMCYVPQAFFKPTPLSSISAEGRVTRPLPGYFNVNISGGKHASFNVKLDDLSGKHSVPFPQDRLNTWCYAQSTAKGHIRAKQNVSKVTFCRELRIVNITECTHVAETMCVSNARFAKSAPNVGKHSKSDARGETKMVAIEISFPFHKVFFSILRFPLYQFLLS